MYSQSWGRVTVTRKLTGLHFAVTDSRDEMNKRLRYSKSTMPLFIYSDYKGPDRALARSCTRITRDYRGALEAHVARLSLWDLLSFLKSR